MGIQMPLPATWALGLETLRHHPAERLDALVQDKLDAKAEIRAVLDRLAGKYGVPASDVNAAMGWVDEGIGDLFYDVELGFQHEIESEDPI
jgi:hypothetical protein